MALLEVKTSYATYTDCTDWQNRLEERDVAEQDRRIQRICR